MVAKLYRTVQKKKLITYFENQKMKPNLTRWHKLIIHITMNIGPQQGINEDIIEEIKEEPAQEEGDAEASPLHLGKKSGSELPAEAMRLDL